MPECTVILRAIPGHAVAAYLRYAGTGRELNHFYIHDLPAVGKSAREVMLQRDSSSLTVLGFGEAGSALQFHRRTIYRERLDCFNVILDLD